MTGETHITSGPVGQGGVTALLVPPPVAAKLLAISERTLWALTKRGELPCVKIGRTVRYYVRDLIAWIERRRGRGQHQ